MQLEGLKSISISLYDVLYKPLFVEDKNILGEIDFYNH